MGAFGGFTLTNKGRNLQAKAQAGAVLNYTRAAIGDGTLTGQSIVALTALISAKKTLPITKLRMIPPDRAAVGTIISNQSITTGFYFREIGIFAQDPDEGEVLYAYANSGANAEYLPPAGGPDVIEKSIDMLVVVGRASQVTATIDSSLVFPTFAEMEDAIEEALASVKVPLVDSNTSTSKTEAPTADALRRTVESTAEALGLKQNVLRLADNYLAASILVNAAPDGSGRSYPDGVSMFKVSSGAGGWPASNGYVLTFRAGSGGYQIFYEMYTGAVQTDKTARQWTRSKRDSNAFWQDWARTMTEVDIAALLPLAGGDMTGRIGRTIDTYTKHFQNLGGGYINNSATGFLKITIPMPIATPVNVTVMSVTIDLTRLTGAQSGGQLKIKGRPIYANGALTWNNVAADIDRSAGVPKVTLAHDGAYLCILLGDANTTWAYPSVSITELFVTGSHLDQWASAPWTVSVIPDLTGIINTLDVPLKISATTEQVDTRLALAGGDMTGAISRTHGASSIREYINLDSAYISGVTGAVKITLPQRRTNTELSIIIEGYDHLSTGGYWRLEISAFAANSSSTPWIYPNAVLSGNAPFSTVTLAEDGASAVIILGGVTTKFTSASISVTKVIAGSGTVTGWGSGWGISVVTDISTLINAVQPVLQKLATQAYADAAVATHASDYVRQPGYAATVGTGAAYTVTLSPAPAALVDGLAITIVPHADNTAADPTLKIGTLGALPIRRQNGTPFAAGSIKAGQPLSLVKVGSYFLARSAAPIGTATAAQVLAGYTFQSEAVPDGGTGTAKENISGLVELNFNQSANFPGYTYLTIATMPVASKLRFAVLATTYIYRSGGIASTVGIGLKTGSTIIKLQTPGYNQSSEAIGDILVDTVTKIAKVKTSTGGSVAQSNDISTLDFSQPLELVAIFSYVSNQQVQVQGALHYG